MEPAEQEAPTIEEQPESRPIAAPDAEVMDQKNADAVPASLAREPLAAPAEGAPADDLSPDIRTAQLENRVIEAISTIYDPEIPVNIYELGLIYDLHVTADNCVRVEMTLTSPACPVAGSLPGEVEQKVRDVDGVRDVALELVWDPPWTPERMSEAAQLELGFM